METEVSASPVKMQEALEEAHAVSTRRIVEPEAEVVASTIKMQQAM